MERVWATVKQDCEGNSEGGVLSTLLAMQMVTLHDFTWHYMTEHVDGGDKLSGRALCMCLVCELQSRVYVYMYICVHMLMWV